jgi:diguanylate cyclase (GGDEF)-like protein
MSSTDTRVTRVGSILVDAAEGEECLVQIYGDRLGHKYDLTATLLVGRGDECDVVLRTDSVSRKHCLFERTADGIRVKDLESTNGTYVNDVAVGQAGLRHGDLIKIGDTIFKYLAAGNVEQAYHEEIYRMTIIDGLTGVHNRRYIQEFLEREVARASRHGRPLSFVLFDLDKFKDVNDNFGHLTGDYVLSQTAELMKGRIRKEEVFGRYGGEEFCAILPETPLAGGIDFAEWFRSQVEGYTFTFDGDEIPVTLSAGIASMGPTIDDWATLVERADAAMYRAKKSGRNRVIGDAVV